MRIFLSITILFCSISIVYGQQESLDAKSLDAVKTKCRQLLLSNTSYATERSLMLTDDVRYKTDAAGYVKNMNGEGSWDDLDYYSKERGPWPAAWHIYRLMMIYRAYHKNNGPEYLACVHEGLQYLINNNFQCDNCYV